MKKSAVKVENLSKEYHLGRSVSETLYGSLVSYFSSSNETSTKRNFWALRDINFEIERGEILGIIGPNGAGKSTLLKVLSRITEPTTGRIVLNGRVSSLLEVGTGFHPELTGRENVFLNGSILGMKKAEIKRQFDEIVDFSGVEQFIDTPVKKYSSGMYVRLAFAVAAHLNTEILFVDEVLSVGDLEFQRKCLNRMEAVAQNQGRTVFIVSHNMAAVKQLSSKIILLDAGRIKNFGGNEVIQEYYSVSNKRNSGQIFRSESFVIHAMSTLNANLSNQTTFFSGEDLIIKIRLESTLKIEDKTKIFATIGIDNMFGDRVFTIRSDYKPNNILELNSNNKFNDLLLRVNRLPLTYGNFMVSILIQIGQEKIHVANGCKFEVVQGNYYQKGGANVPIKGQFFVDYDLWVG